MGIKEKWNTYPVRANDQIKYLKSLLDNSQFKISIIIPVYNVENYIRNALDSIVRQTIGLEYLEVIMVNDCSIDNSGKIIDEYANRYGNFVAIHLSKNSGAAGRPRNIGIENSTGDYIMFLDPDDYYMDETCEVLYEKVTKENVDVVFGKYNIHYDNATIVEPSFQLFESDKNEIKATNIEEKKVFFGAPPSIWTKIFKRSFIQKNNIFFPEGIPAQDLVFYVHSLLKANGVIYINKIMTSYRKRSDSNKSISFNRNKKYMLGLTQAYTETYYICKDNNKEEYFALTIKNHLIHWTRQFVLSGLSTSEKKEVLKLSCLFFKKYSEYNLTPPQYLASFFDSVRNERYGNAILLSEELIDSMKNLERPPTKLESNKSSKKIFMLCDKIPAELGGLARVILNRSQRLAERGYDVSILTIESDNNYDFIGNLLKKRKQLYHSVNLINIYNYYENNNSKIISSDYITRMKEISKIHENGFNVINEYENQRRVRYFYEGKYIKLKKWNNDGSLNFIDHFDKNGVRIKRKKFLNGFLKKELSYLFNGMISQKRHFTKDGFCYFTEYFDQNGKERELLLFDRNKDVVTSFNNSADFHKYFLTELCKACDNKPYLICDGSGPTPTISNIDSSIAYTISQLHSNPYTGPYGLGSPMRHIGILESIDKLDAFITLTERQRHDIINQFGDYENTYCIPNSIPRNKLLNLEKIPNKISIFARIASEKQIDHAIKAFKIVVSKRKNAKLEIFGRATLPAEVNELKKIKKLIKELQLENNVFINGYITNVYKEMEESVAVLLTSKFEGFGLVIIEAMLNSTPVISYDVNYGPSDIIDHGIDGFIVESGNINLMAKYIVELLDNAEKAKQMGVAARKKILEHYTNDVVIPKWEKLFKKIHYDKVVNKKNIISNLNEEKSLKNLQIEYNGKSPIDFTADNNNFTQKFISNLYPLYILFKRDNYNMKNVIINIKGYRAIKKNKLLDVDYYLKKNGDVRLSGMDPILHYLYHGYGESRKPNHWFDGDDYLSAHGDVRKSNLNPLVHYSLYGIKEGRKTKITKT